MFDEQKPGEQHLAPELVALERQLLGLTPALPRIDRDRLMFEAGRASVQGIEEPSPSPSLKGRGIEAAATQRIAGRRGWFWPAATALTTAASLLLATMLISQNRAQFVVQQSTTPPAQDESDNITQVSNDLPAEQFVRRDRSMKPVLSDGYLGIRYIAVTAGVGALPDKFQSGAAIRDVPDTSKSSEPATVRNLMNELLPASTPPNSSRS